MKGMIKRIKRLYPQYILTIILATVGVFTYKHIIAVKDFILHAFFLQNYNWIESGYTSELQSMTAHTWTMCVDVALYLFWLMLMKITKKNTALLVKANLVLIVVAVAFRVICICYKVGATTIMLIPLSHVDAFAIGSILATKEEKLSRGKSILFIVAGIFLIILSIGMTAYTHGLSLIDGYKLYNSSDNYMNNWLTCNVILFLTVFFVGLFGLFRAIDVEKSKTLTVLATFGEYTYTAYLFHWPLRVVMIRFFENKTIMALTNIVLSLIGAYIVDNVIKKSVSTRSVMVKR